MTTTTSLPLLPQQDNSIMTPIPVYSPRTKSNPEMPSPISLDPNEDFNDSSSGSEAIPAAGQQVQQAKTKATTHSPPSSQNNNTMSAAASPLTNNVSPSDSPPSISKTQKPPSPDQHPRRTQEPTELDYVSKPLTIDNETFDEILSNRASVEDEFVVEEYMTPESPNAPQQGDNPTHSLSNRSLTANGSHNNSKNSIPLDSEPPRYEKKTSLGPEEWKIENGAGDSSSNMRPASLEDIRVDVAAGANMSASGGDTPHTAPADASQDATIIDNRPSFRRSTHASSRKKRKVQRSSRKVNRFSWQASNGQLMGRNQVQEAERQRMERIERMKRAKEQASKLNRYSARYMKRGSQIKSDIDVVSIIEQKLVAMIRGYVVRFKLERQILAAVKIQRFWRDTRPLFQRWRLHWNKIWQQRLTQYVLVQSNFRAQAPIQDFEHSRACIIKVQSALRSLMEQQQPLNQYAYVKEQVQQTSEILADASHAMALESQLRSIVFVQRELGGVMYLMQQTSHLPTKKNSKGKACCVIM